MYAIVDIETTGGNYRSDRITEIAVFLFDGTRVVDQFTTLINPERIIPYFITRLTGITNEMVRNAPRFYEVAKRIVEITERAVFVAHNASFDYNFIREEYKRLGYHYNRKNLCTVKLSRKLLPHMPSYSLGKLCNSLGITNDNRHRASGDAYATVQLFRHLLTIDDQFTSYSFKNLHPKFEESAVDNLPDDTGVYFFFDEHDKLIYIGKSRNIKKRVISHLNGNKSARAMEMKSRIVRLDYEVTGSELVALLLESELIKEHMPVFNRAQRRVTCTYGLFSDMDKNGYINLKIGKIEKHDSPVTCFTSAKSAKETLFGLTEQHRLCQKLNGLYKTTGACFHYSVSQCLGACIGAEPPESYNARVVELLNRFSFDKKNFFIIEKGRFHNERAVVQIENGRYMGFGYLNIHEQYCNVAQLRDSISLKRENRDVRQIIQTYLKTKKSERIIPYD